MVAKAARHEDEDPYLHRLKMLCDGVFAISLTLLALELKPPADWHGHGLLAAMKPKLIAYALSFFLIAVFWTSHRRTFQSLLRADFGLCALTLVFLGLIALLPAATALTMEPSGPESFRIYLGLVTITGLVQGAGWAYAAFVGGLVAPEVSFGGRVFVTIITSVMPGAACALSLYSGQTGSPWGWIGAGALAVAVSVGRRMVARRSQRTPAGAPQGAAGRSRRVTATDRAS